MPVLIEARNHAKLYTQLADRIEKLIIDGQLKPGDRLPAERELSEQFSVSRTVVREAVKALQEKGLVEIRPGVGTFVHDSMSEIMQRSLARMVMIDQQNGLENLTQVREIFEPEIAAIAAEKATLTDIRAMKAAITTMDATMDDVDAFITADHEFHLALAKATQNQLIVDLIGSIVNLLAEQRRLIFLAETGGPQRGQQHHKTILQAVIDGDKQAARDLMALHLNQVRTDSAISRANDNES